MTASLHNLPIVAGILKRTDVKAKDRGMVMIMREIIDRSRSRMTVINKSEKLKRLLTDEPVLVIANHPAEADVPILLSTLENRQDIYLIASHQFLNILPNIDNNVIPVYIGHRIAENNKLKNRIFNRIHESEKYNRDEAHKKNIESINLAAEKINKGAAVVIFPAAEELGGSFRPGVGHIIKNLKDSKKVRVVMVYIEGTSDWDYLRLIPFLGKLLPKIKVTFARPFGADEIKTDDGKKGAKKLEERYYRWLEKLGHRKEAFHRE